MNVPTREAPACDDNDARDHLFARDLRARRGARRSLRGKWHQAASRESWPAALCRSVLGLGGDRPTLLRDLFLSSLPPLSAAILSRAKRRFRFGRGDHVHQRALELSLLPYPESLPRLSARTAVWHDRNFSFPLAPAPARPHGRVVSPSLHSLPFLRESLGLSRLEIEPPGTVELTLWIRLRRGVRPLA